ncbi:DUF4215 domain-containing protein, partial [Patescibacteria group bacterium]|nr:DUF4215 domain-containing protein [Patescibacteria group bacterium]
DCACIDANEFFTSCGNRRIDPGEECEPPGTNYCDVRCNLIVFPEDDPWLMVEEECGDMILDSTEQCDDGNIISGDGCSAFCLFETTIIASSVFCGDGKIDMNEECDDGNQRDLDGCSSMCFLEFGFCGDGIVQRALDEQCEPILHNRNLPYGCANDCRFDSALCGDGKIDPGEQCDAGIRNSDSLGSICRKNCSSVRCGDYILDSNEGCDDGNILNGDGCDNTCREEVGAAFASEFAFPQLPLAQQASLLQQIQTYPGTANLQSLGYQLPLANIAQLTANRPPAGDTGPAAIAVISMGSAAGFGWMRRKKRQKS